MSNAHLRSAIVTGGSKGIGAAIAKRLARDGFAVSVNYGHDREAAEAVVAEIIQSGGQAIAVQADLADRSSMATLFNAAEKIFGGVDVLVNNAGTMPLSPLADVEDDDFERIVGLNLGGVFRGMREAARRMRDGGRVISFSSSVVGLYQPTYSVYGATKGAIEAMTHILAKELAPRGITVNAVSPGPIDTGLFRHGKTPQQIEAIEKLNPFGRLGQPDEIASLVAFLASPDSAWVNGQTIRANGGVV
jgi:3-oxoacyl-[acyl-carrier protein] reductase